jgi:dCTP deaminase
MILNDSQITRLARAGMIRPFTPKLVRCVADRQVLSYGLCSYGYDLRLSPKEFKIFRHLPGKVVDPKSFSPASLEPAGLHRDAHGRFFILPGRSYGLGANVTPAEAGWQGHLTLEFSNSSAADCRIYAGEGIVQMVFLQGEACRTSYSSRSGKYQKQPHRITLPRA